METRSRVVLADDHLPTRIGVRMALEEAGLEVVADVADAGSAVEAALRERPEACLLDVYMPGGGIEAARRIKKALPETAIVMLTVSADDDDLFAALQAGASGYLLKDMPADRLAFAVRGVLAGEAALPRRLTARVLSALHTAHEHGVRVGPSRLVDRLTSREREVADLMLQDCSTGRIAVRLGTSPVTVRRHVSAIVRKVGAANRRDALRALRAERDRPPALA
jgi:two-component system, NarL family, nitrate/nitrite response regulator NarL